MTSAYLATAVDQASAIQRGDRVSDGTLLDLQQTTTTTTTKENDQ